MKVAILEDERPAAELLVAALRDADPDIVVTGVFDAAGDLLDALERSGVPDLIVADLRVSDGLSMDTFRERPPPCPVVYVTAYDAHRIEAFERGAIDYVLKPLDPARIAAALEKYRRLEAHFLGDRTPRARALTVRRGRDHLAIPLADVAWFCTEHRLVFVVRLDGARFVVDRTLGELAEWLDPVAFHRVNRSWIVARAVVRGWRAHGKGRLAVLTDPPAAEAVVVPADGAHAFREWLGA